MAVGEDGSAAAFERALGLEGLSSEAETDRAEREHLEYRLAPLASLLKPVTPSADLFDRIIADIGVKTPLAGIHVARITDGTWAPHCNGVDTKTLWHSPKSRRHVFLVRIQPDAILPEHPHGGDEECIVLEGDLVVNGVSFGPGDFQVSFAGTVHPTIPSRQGCICLISLQLQAS